LRELLLKVPLIQPFHYEPNLKQRYKPANFVQGSKNCVGEALEDISDRVRKEAYGYLVFKICQVDLITLIQETPSQGFVRGVELPKKN
jgi:hypothetical protein